MLRLVKKEYINIFLFLSTLLILCSSSFFGCCSSSCFCLAKHREEDKDLIRQDSRIRDEVKQAIFDNGGIAIGILSPNEKVQMAGDDWFIYDKFLDKENIIKQIELCDGIFARWKY